MLEADCQATGSRTGLCDWLFTLEHAVPWGNRNLFAAYSSNPLGLVVVIVGVPCSSSNDSFAP